MFMIEAESDKIEMRRIKTEQIVVKMNLRKENMYRQ